MAINYTEPRITPAHPVGADMNKDWIVWFRYLNPGTGKWVMKSYKKGINCYHNYRERLAQANALRQVLKEELATGWNPLTGERDLRITTIQQALQYVLNLKAKSVRPKTITTYRHIIRLLNQWLDSSGHPGMPLHEFTPQLAQQYMDHLVTARNYSGRTHNDHLIILSTFFNAIVQREWMAKNPFKSVKRMQTTVGRNLAYSEAEREQLKKILKSKDRWLYYFTQFMYYTFIRRTELTKIRVGDLDYSNHSIIIRAEVSKNKIQESVVIPQGLEPIINEMRLNHYPDHFFVFGRHLFPSEIQYVNPDHITARHGKFVRRAGIEGERNLYSWKHSGVVAAYYATGKDIYSVMRQLRHRDLNTTSIYLKSLGLIQNDVFRSAMVA